ncbi:hypothetical protein Tco_0099132 [Tanacetum coccineum]
MRRLIRSEKEHLELRRNVRSETTIRSGKTIRSENTIRDEKAIDSEKNHLECTLPTQGMKSIISTVSISPEGFLPSILLPVVIIVTVVIVVVTVILVVVVVAIIGVVIVVMIIGVVVVFMIIREFGVVVVSSIIKFSFFEALKRPGYLVDLLYSNRFGIGIPPGQGILDEITSRKFHFVVLGTVATRKYRFSSFKPTWTGSLPSGCVDLTGDEDPTDEDGDIGMGDSTGVSASLGGEIFSGGKKC